MKNRISVMLIDDHAVLLDSLEFFLVSNNVEVKAKCKTKDEAIIAIETCSSIDIALLDINLSGDDGSNLIRDCLMSQIKTIILSSYADIRIVKKCIKKGAVGYLLKDSPPEQIFEAIDRVRLGEVFIDPIIRDNMVQLKFNPQALNSDSERVIWSMLTPREKQVLKLLSMEMTSEEISKELFIARSTVDTHRKNLIEKLKVKNAVGLGVWAAQNGII